MKPIVKVTAVLKEAQRGHLLISHQNIHLLMHSIRHPPNAGHLLCRLSSVLYGAQQLVVQGNEQYYRMRKLLKSHVKVCCHAALSSCTGSENSLQKEVKNL
jgi:hypothetical protein